MGETGGPPKQQPTGGLPAAVGGPIAGQLPGRVRFAVRFAAGTSVAVLLAGYAVSALQRYLVNDDYQLLYLGWLTSLGKVPGVDFVAYSTHGLVHVLALLVSALGESLDALVVGRWLMLLVLGGVALVAARLTALLCGSTAGWFAPVLVGASTIMLNRALDLRPDLLTTLLWLWALHAATLQWVAPDSRADRRRSIVIGLLLGFVLVNRFKGALACPFIAVLLLASASTPPGAWQARLQRVGRRFGVVVAAAAVPVVLYALLLWSEGALSAFVRVNLDLWQTLGQTADVGLDRSDTFALLLRHDGWWCAAALVGGALRLWDARRFDRRKNLSLLVLALLAAASVWLNPAYYAYNLVTLLPLLVPMAAYLPARLVETLATRWPSAEWLASLSAVAFGLAPLLFEVGSLSRIALTSTNRHQRALCEYLVHHTPADYPVFALEGVGLFRPSVYHYRLQAVFRPRYERGDFDFRSELRKTRPELVVLSYRIPGWLTAADRGFLAQHYVPINRDFAVLGRQLRADGQETVELLRGGEFERMGATSCRVDEATVRLGQTLQLSAGRHVVAGGAGCGIRRHIPAEARALLENPTVIPYVVGPGWLVP